MSTLEELDDLFKCLSVDSKTREEGFKGFYKRQIADLEKEIQFLKQENARLLNLIGEEK